MDNPTETQNAAFAKARARLAALQNEAGAPKLNTQGTRRVEAWFLGPKGENADEFERLVAEAVRDQAYWRRNYHPEDPTHISEEIKRHPEYQEAMGLMRDEYRNLLGFLKKSVPFFSMRYQGHMNWDLTLPGLLGYFAAMLYNPNNVALEGSTATTLLELVVGDDLCQMLGYTLPKPDEIEAGAIRPWGHITCDGTVANIEALWCARNLKFYPFALRAALEKNLAAAGAVEITLPSGTRKRVLELSTWELLNLPPDEVLALPERVATEFSLEAKTVADAIGTYSLQRLGLPAFFRRFMKDSAHDPVVLVSGTKHYSFPKAVALLGIGGANLVDVPVDLDARLDVAELDKRLAECLRDKRPVLAVVAVIGTTEESAVDPIAQVVELREKYAKLGLVFHLHADAAWGGYHRSVINEPFDLPDPGHAPAFGAPPPIAAPLSQYVVKQFEALGHADSITVDPHKSGYIPYPAGALCYRNAAMRNLVTFSAPVVFHGEAEPTVGIYGVEGSKPGAAAAAVYLSHRVIRPTRDGYGKIISQALFSCRKFYARLLTMAKPADPFIIVPLPRLPAERRGGDASTELRRVFELIDQQKTADIENNPEAMALLREIGPDENILAYALNFRLADGTINTSLKAANDLNKALYDHMSIDPGDNIYSYDMIVSTTDLDPAAYGPQFMADYQRRLGLSPVPGQAVTVLRSVVMDPWLTDTDAGSFIDVLERELRKVITAVLPSVRPDLPAVPAAFGASAVTAPANATVRVTSGY